MERTAAPYSNVRILIKDGFENHHHVHVPTSFADDMFSSVGRFGIDEVERFWFLFSNAEKKSLHKAIILNRSRRMITIYISNPDFNSKYDRCH